MYKNAGNPIGELDVRYRDFILTVPRTDRLVMVASTVSSKMIEAMARTEGFQFVECLTGTSDSKPQHRPSPRDHCLGFKFIGNTALNLVQKGFEVPFGYEEAIGYMFGSQIRDKDGIAATVSLFFLSLALDVQLKCCRLSSRNSLYCCIHRAVLSLHIWMIYTRGEL